MIDFQPLPTLLSAAETVVDATSLLFSGSSDGASSPWPPAGISSSGLAGPLWPTKRPIHRDPQTELHTRVKTAQVTFTTTHCTHCIPADSKLVFFCPGFGSDDGPGGGPLFPGLFGLWFNEGLGCTVIVIVTADVNTCTSTLGKFATGSPSSCCCRFWIISCGMVTVDPSGSSCYATTR
jgi:hypothetical protein